MASENLAEAAMRKALTSFGATLEVNSMEGMLFDKKEIIYVYVMRVKAYDSFIRQVRLCDAFGLTDWQGLLGL